MTSYLRFGWIRNTTTAVVFATLLGGCLSKDEGSTSFDGLRREVQLSGNVGDGPVVGANMRVTSKDGSLIAEFQSDANAGYNITINTQESHYPLTISATGGIDLVTNAAPDFKMSGAAFESSDRSIANVNPFSTFAVALAAELPGGLGRTNLEDAQQTVTTVLNSGLDSLAVTGPMGTRVDETNIAEIVKASETLAELVRRTRGLLQSAGFGSNGDAVVRELSSDLSDGVVDGLGGSNVDRRTAAVSTIVYAQVLLESMANELRVNGNDASSAMRDAINQVSAAPPTTTIDELPVTAGMIEKARVGLAAAYAIAADSRIAQVHAAVSGIQSGQSATLVRILLPANYRTALQNVLAVIASADDATLDLVNAVARTNGDIEITNLAPTIQGSPATSVVAGSAYSFTPNAADPDGDPLVFEIVNKPSWAVFNSSTGRLSGTPSMSDVGVHSNIVISVTDGEFSISLAAFTIAVTASNSAPQISGTASGSVKVGESYSFTPTASDPDGDTLTFSISGLPPWANFNASTGQISGTPGAGDVGTSANIYITVSDGQASATLAPFSITVQAISLGSVTLSWTPPTENEDGSALIDLAGYKIYWGTMPGNYPNSVTINNASVSIYIVENLSPGTYEFVATSFNASGVESRFSNTATKVVQ